MKSWIEALTDLDLSSVIVTLGQVAGNITFAPTSTIDWTNVLNTGTQNFDSNYIANYD
jgi:hypothetical protein